MASVVLDGFPPVIRMKFFQGSDSKPGRCIIDMMVLGPDLIEKLPRFTTLTVNTRDFTGIWLNMRVTKSPRVRHGYTRVVLEDNRWLLREIVLDKNYNDRDSLGNVKSDREKTIEELGEILDESTGDPTVGLTITTGEVPEFKPGAKWAGERADVALGKLLKHTGCRFVYNPITQIYTIASANTGTNLSEKWNERVYRPGPPATLAIVNIVTSPVLYEDRMVCFAKQINMDTGELETQDDIILARAPDEDYAHTRFRLWAPDMIEHPRDLGDLEPDDVLLLDHRAKAHLYDPENPMHERGRIIRDDWDRYPHHQPLYNPKTDIPRLVELTGGARVFLTDHPVLMVGSSGDLLDTCKLLTSYYVKEEINGVKVLHRNKVEVILTGTGTDILDIEVPWLKPVDSTEEDMEDPVWDDLHVEVADAIKKVYEGDTATIKLSNPTDLSGSGYVGAVMYECDSNHSRAKIFFQVAINFSPGAEGSIH